MKRVKFITLLTGAILLCTVISAIAISNSRLIGHEIKELEQKTDVVVFSVNGENISEQQFETYKKLMRETNKLLTDEEIKDKYIRQRVIIQEAKRRGYTVSKKEIEELNDSRFQALEKDQKAYQIIKDYVDGLGITMEEYQERSKIVSEQAIITTKLKNDIESEYLNGLNAKTLSSYEERQKAAEIYYNTYIDPLVDDAEIIYQ